MKWKEKQDFSLNYRILVARAFIHPYFWFLTSNFTALGLPYRTHFCLLAVIVPRFLSPYSLPPFWKNLHICPTSISWSRDLLCARCQGLLKTRRHIENREDPLNPLHIPPFRNLAPKKCKPRKSCSAKITQ